jgi:hypothetical protein
MTKLYKLAAQDIKPLVAIQGGCFATDRITVDGCRVGYMYREEPDEGRPDSGWRFTAGDESDAYMDDSARHGIYAVNTIANCDPSIVPILDAPAGSAYERDENGEWVSISALETDP